jgi:hypothetical protein
MNLDLQPRLKLSPKTRTLAIISFWLTSYIPYPSIIIFSLIISYVPASLLHLALQGWHCGYRLQKSFAVVGVTGVMAYLFRLLKLHRLHRRFLSSLLSSLHCWLDTVRHDRTLNKGLIVVECMCLL